MSEEEWRQTPCGAYEVSNLGRVKRIKRAKGARVGAIIKTHKVSGHYEHVTLCVDCVLRSAWVHTLVAELFIGPRPDGMQVNHRDGDKHNNVLSNLEYVIPRDNMQHAIRTGLRKPQPEETRNKGTKNWAAKIRDEDVIEIRKLVAEGATIRAMYERFGLSKCTVHNIVNRKTWRHLP